MDLGHNILTSAPSFMMGRMSLHTIISRLCNYFTSLSVILCNCHCFRVIAQAVTELDNKTTHRQADITIEPLQRHYA
ncbi:hypothetical protein BN1200_540011 [Klebsiella variicola]|nr:hypothetical protein BN1200_540011 [Klebsiella variicola]